MKKKLTLFLFACSLFAGNTMPCFAADTQGSFLAEATAIPEPVKEEFTFELSSFSTKIQLASDSINGYILKPDATFSYNQVILSKSNQGEGYKEASILINGKPATGVGGGICQVSSTLFEAAVYSGIAITERHNHSAKVGYLSPGRDATVSWGGPDLQFKNTLPIDIKIESTVNNGVLTIRFLTKEDPHLKRINVWTEYDKASNTYVLKRSYDGWIDYKTYSKYKS
ncbi:MAG: VanW family protein [Firmicutes bacterium]|nr:VanW family protein [Bacillota bacterium]